jgi:hypothetical protein
VFSSAVIAQDDAAVDRLAEAIDPANLELDPIFLGYDGGLEYLRETEKHVCWFAEHPGAGYAYVFTGRRNGKRIRGRMISVSKFSAKEFGLVVMEIHAGGLPHQIGEAMNARFTRLAPDCRLYS